MLPTNNPEWGFWGTMGKEAATAWPIAFSAIAKATGHRDADDIRAFLDSRHGRHFADSVANHAARGLPAAIEAAIAEWMRPIGRGPAAFHQMPREMVGFPALTAFVMQAGVAEMMEM
jgi:hypothetical protein